MKMLNPAVVRVLKRLHYPLDVILTCVRWYGFCRDKGKMANKGGIMRIAYAARE